MAEDKKIQDDIDDWLDDIDDGDEFGGELDQANIDALLSGADKAADGGSAAPGGEKEAAAELDQANIDALLNGGGGAPAAEADSDSGSAELDQANIDALFSELDEESESAEASAPSDSPELDQSNIDALLGGVTETPAPSEASESGELDQANIDALLAGGKAKPEQAEAAAEVPASAAAQEELDQADIDLLLGGGDDEQGPQEVTAREEAEKLLGGGAPGPEIDLADGFDADQDEIDQLFAGLDDDEEEIDEPFEADDLDLAGVLEGEDTMLEIGEEVQPVSSESSPAAYGVDAPIQERDSTNGSAPQGQEEEKKSGLAAFLPQAVNRTVIGVITACIALVAGTWLFFSRSQTPDTPPITGVEPETQQAAAPAVPQPAANFIPVALESKVNMPEKGGEVAVVLGARDDDNDPLTYQIASQPRYGRLSGQAPNLIYLPNKEFPGEDRFEFVVNDGKEGSGPALVVISGPNLAQLAADEEKKKGEEQKKSSVRRAAAGKQRTLKRGTAKRTAPPPPDKAPVIHVARLSERYQVGETVVIDASRTTDESRTTVRFSWEQLSGTPVLIEPANQEGSIISFTSPSFFYTVTDPGPVLRLTAVDQTGKEDVRVVKVRTVSRRQTALWHGERDRGGPTAEGAALQGRLAMP